MGKPLLGSPEMRALLLDVLDTLNGMFGRETRADRAKESFRLATEKMFARHRRARAKQKAALSKIKQWKEHYRKRLRKFEDPDFDFDQDAPNGGSDMMTGETSDEHRERLANLILYGLDWLEGAEVDWKNGEFEDYDDFLEQVQPEWLWELMNTLDSNYDDAEGPTSGEPDAPLQEFPLLATGSQLFSVPWPGDTTGPSVFPPMPTPFLLKGISVNVEGFAIATPTVGFDLTITDGVGNTLLTTTVAGGVLQGPGTFQFFVPAEIPDRFIVLPTMRCELNLVSGSSPPGPADYRILLSVWMIDTSPLLVAS